MAIDTSRIDWFSGTNYYEFFPPRSTTRIPSSSRIACLITMTRVRHLRMLLREGVEHFVWFEEDFPDD